MISAEPAWKALIGDESALLEIFADPAGNWHRNDPDHRNDLLSVAWELLTARNYTPATALYWAHRTVRLRRRVFAHSQRDIAHPNPEGRPKRFAVYRPLGRLTGREPDPAEEAASRVDVEAWMKTLPPRYREIISGLQAGMTPAEIATAAGRSAEAVRVMIRRMRRLWGEFCGE